MEIAQIIWLVICGVVIIAGFWLGSYYLSEWKDACVDYAKYKAKSEVNLKKKSDDKWIDTYESEIAESLVQKQICFPVWSVSFTLVIVFLGIVAWTLFK
jgi:hypothetical protein